MSDVKQHKTAGFAAMEALLLLIIVGLVAGVGYWVFTQRAKKTSDTTTSSTVAPTTTAAAGTAS